MTKKTTFIKLHVFSAIIVIMLFCGSSHGCFIVGDLSGDCRVDIDDLALAASQWMGSSCDGETGLVAHWKLNESSNSTAVDSSGSGYNGIVSGARWNPAGGMFGGALEFDGENDYVWISQGYKGVLGAGPRTCASWIKTDQPSGEIMTWGDLDVDSNAWVVWLDENGVLCVDVGGGHVKGSIDLTDDLWHHIAVTSGEATTDGIVLYVDGRIEIIADVVSQSIDTQGKATAKLGVYLLPYLQGDFFNGLIDDAKIYDRVLTMKEIRALAITGTTNFACPDMNADGTVNINDFAKLLQNWQEAAPQILINEFLADNESKSPLESGEILDGNNESSDWIELHNNSRATIDISGWYLTDEYNLKTKWEFPLGMSELILEPGDYVVVFASGKTYADNPGNYPYVDSAGHLHTNFQLSNKGEYLALYAADGVTPIHEYNHVARGDDEFGYPRQEEDISYGYYYDEPSYFAEPTPGIANKDSFTEFAEKPDVNIKGGCYENDFELTMSCDTPDAFIRYTTDGTVPSLVNGTVYSGPIHIDSLTTLIAKSFKAGYKESKSRIESYIFIDPAVTSFNSNLPIVVIDTLGEDMPRDKVLKPYVDCRAVIIDTDEVTGRASVTGPEHFAGIGQIRRRGESTYGQGHYAFEVQDEYGMDKDVPLLGMPGESDWVLSYDVIDYSMMKNEIAFKWFRDMGHYAPRQRYVELYLNTGGGKISSSDYKGLFMLRENVKRSKNRVDIARIDTSHNLEPKVSGGYIIKNDKYSTGDLLLKDYMEKAYYGIAYDGGGKAILSDPGPLEITESQITWITDYMNVINAVLWQNTSSSYYPGSSAEYTDYIDAVSFIDHGIVEQVCADSDAFWGSYYTHKDRDGIIHSGPTWDYDRSFHNNGGSYDKPFDTWKSNGAIFGRWHQKMQEDLEYKILLADRWFEHREEVLNTDMTMAHIDETMALISEARSRPKKTYPKPFTEEVQLFKDWITSRLNWLDGEIGSRFAGKPPIFNHSSRYVAKDSTLVISKPSGAGGTIYYTLDGNDPRLPGGAVNSNVRIYSDAGGEILESIVAKSAAIWKYLYDGSDQGTPWREYGFDDSSWGSGAGQLGFNEGDENTNIGPKVTGRRTAYFRHKFTVSNISEITKLKINILHDDGAVIYINGQEVDRIYMPDGTISYDTLSSLQGENTNTVLNDISPSYLNEGDNVIAVEVHQKTDNSSDISFDLALEVTRILSGDQIVFDKSTRVIARLKDGNDWSAKNQEVYAVGPVVENLRISELMYHPADPNTEFIELQNVGSETINLNLVEFTKGVEFVAGDTSLAAGEYGLIVQNIEDFTTKYGTDLNVLGQYLGRLDNDGDRIELTDALGTVVQSFEYKDGWYELTDGMGFSLTMVNPFSSVADDWDSKNGWRSSLYADGTPGQGAETALGHGDIVINELLAHSHASDPDWIELYNTTDWDIDISGWFLSDDDWDSNMIRKYEIPANTVISAGAYMVFIEDDSFGDPTATGSNIPFGLSEGGETVYLYSGQDGEVTGFYQTQQKFYASETGISFGRYEKAELSGGYDFVRMMPTPGEINNEPLASDIVITEINYNPTGGTDYEFVELYNRSGHDVTLMTEVTTYTSETSFTTEWLAWRIEGTGFEFPPNTTLTAGQRIIVAKDPTKFSLAYGPYDGKLDNGGEELEIQMPGDKEFGKDRYWIGLEKIDYSDGSHPIETDPWPTTPDGGGDSLHRIDADTYGRDYSNWTASPPTPGT